VWKIFLLVGKNSFWEVNILKNRKIYFRTINISIILISSSFNFQFLNSLVQVQGVVYTSARSSEDNSDEVKDIISRLLERSRRRYNPVVICESVMQQTQFRHKMKTKCCNYLFIIGGVCGGVNGTVREFITLYIYTRARILCAAIKRFRSKWEDKAWPFIHVARIHVPEYLRISSADKDQTIRTWTAKSQSRNEFLITLTSN
jgi:hypothetical protein